MTARAIAEGKKTLIMVLYLWLFLAVLNLHKTVVLQQRHIDYDGLGFAIVNAIILVKVMVAADELHVGTRFRGKSLIYHALYSAFWFAVILTVFHILEGVLLALLHARPLSNSLQDFGRGDLGGVLAISAIAFVAFVPFFLFREIGRVAGEDELWSLVLRRGSRNYRLVVRE